MLRMLAPAADPAKIPPKKPVKYANIFRQGELAMLITSILRVEGRPMGVAEINKIVMDRGGFDKNLWSPMRRRLRANLAYLQAGGRVSKSGSGVASQWSDHTK